MAKAVRGTPPSAFTPPPGIVMTPVDSTTGRRVCGSDDGIAEAFRQGSEPAECESLVDTPALREIASWFRGIFR
jgi:membrane carboxypeptidase/penicillin-binding protein